MTNRTQNSIRPGCLRPADDLWEQPTGDEVREVLRRAGLTGAAAARLLGMKGATGRGIRRYTGDEAPIPYPSWALLCDVAGLGQIWRAEADDQDSPRGEPAAQDVGTQLTECLELAERQIEDIWSGKIPASAAAISECRDASIRVRQAEHALSVAGNVDDIPLQLKKRIAQVQEKLKVMASWMDLG